MTELKKKVNRQRIFVPLKTENPHEFSSQYIPVNQLNIHINAVHIVIDYCKIHIDKMSALLYVCVCVTSLRLAI